eukprot:275573_1
MTWPNVVTQTIDLIERRYLTTGFVRESQKNMILSYTIPDDIYNMVESYYQHPQFDENKAYIKAAIIGDSQVGKTTFCRTYINGSYIEPEITRLVIYIHEKRNIFKINKCNISLYLQDFGHGQMYQEIGCSLYKTKIVLFAFNLMNKNSLFNIKRWYKECR